jgi:hypothetical protein
MTLYLFNLYFYYTMNKIIIDIISNTKTFKYPENNKWGFTQYSEKINGRIAMLSFIILFIIELITKQNLTSLLMLVNFG